MAFPLPQLRQSWGTFDVVAKALAWSFVMMAMMAFTVFLSFFVPFSSFLSDSRRSARANNLTS